jgi:VanZ family protein
MNIKIVRIFELLIFGYLCTIPNPKMLLIYNAVLYGFVEILNFSKAYKNQKYYTIYNTLFVVYQLFCVFNRSRSFRFSTFTEEIINIFEHFIFANIICVLVSQIYLLFKPNQGNSFNKSISIFFIFNTIGFFNEIFQNWISVRPIDVITGESWKDIGVNMVGSLFFIVIQFFMNRR